MGDLVQTAQGGDDTGGSVHLWHSVDVGESWQEYDLDAWGAVKNWGVFSSFPMGWYHATETGNGTAYVGESDWSQRIVQE